MLPAKPLLEVAAEIRDALERAESATTDHARRTHLLDALLASKQLNLALTCLYNQGINE